MSSVKRKSEAESDKLMKRKHVALTITQKIEILKKLDNGTAPRNLAETYGISVRTVYDIRKNKDKLLEFYVNSDCNKAIQNRKTLHKAKSDNLDAVLFQWFKQRRSEGVPITGPLLREKAKQLHTELGNEVQCCFSAGWLKRFKDRHGIRYFKIRGEKISADSAAAEEFIDEFSKFVSDEKLTPHQIYNMDETALFWRGIPRKTLTAPHESGPIGVKESKERITVLTCSNAAGTHKCKLLVIGKNAKPRAFKGIKVFPVIYRHNKRAWMTQEICIDWFKNHFIREARNHCNGIGLPENCKIVLLVDNCPAHPDLNNVTSENVRVTFLPPNTTALIQPMDQGIIWSLKCHYKTKFLTKLLNSDPSLTFLENYKKSFNIRDCIYMLSDAWNFVSQDALINAWHKLWPPSLFFESECEEPEFSGFKLSMAKQKSAELLEYAKNVNSYSFSSYSEDEILEWMVTCDEVPVTSQITDAEIISSVLDPVISDSDTDSDCEEEKIPFDQGLALGEQYIKFIEKQSCINHEDVMVVYRIQEKLQKEKQKKFRQPTIKEMFSKQKFSKN